MFAKEEIDYLPLSGVQHYDFCSRQWALIHVEQLWQENLLTFSGRSFHEQVDNPFFTETRKDRFVTRSVPLVSASLGLYGVADVVEFHRQNDKGIPFLGRDGLWMPYPVEYKVGRPKSDDCDRVQLCAQTICLEEMYEVTIAEGALFYGRVRRREVVRFDQDLRGKTRFIFVYFVDVGLYRSA